MDDDDDDVQVMLEEEPWRLAVASGSLQQLQDLVSRRGLAVLSRNAEDLFGREVTTPLLEAARLDHADMVRYLVEECSAVVDINACYDQDNEALTSLHFATQANNIELVRYLVQKGSDVNAVCVKTKSPLHMAAEKGYVAIVKLFIDTGLCNVDLATSANNDEVSATPLLLAIYHGKNLEIVQYIMDRGPWTDEEKVDRATKALPAACKCGNVSMAQYLVESHRANVNVEASDHYDGYTPVLLACEHGSLPLVQYLVEKCHVNVEAYSCNGWKMNPLLQACDEGHLDVVQYLVEKCAVNVNATRGGFKDASPLHFACHSGELGVVQYLVENCRADVEATDAHGDTALLRAAKCGPLDIVQYLVGKCGADIEARNLGQCTALHMACESRALAVVKYLVDDRHVSVNVPNSKGETALHLASQRRSIEMVQCLIQSGRSNVNAVDENGRTAMHSCLVGQYHALGAVDDDWICLTIAKSIATIDQTCFEMRNHDGETILHLACEMAVLKLVKYLVQDCRVDVNAANSRGETALHMASCQNHVEMVQCLIQSGRITNINAVDAKGRTAMHICLDYGRYWLCGADDDARNCLPIVKIFAAVDQTNFETRDNDGRTLLQQACKKGLFQLVQYLVQECRVNVNIASNVGETPLHIACRERRVELAHYLSNLPRVDVNAVDMNGRTPLHFVCSSVAAEERARNNPLADGRGYTSGNAANCCKIVDCLLKTSRVNVNAQDEQGKTALHHSFVNTVETVPYNRHCQNHIHSVCFRIVQSLVESGQADVNSTDHMGQTVLHYYCSFPNIDIPHYLIEQAHANVDVMDNEGRTALHRAASIERGTGVRSGLPLVLFLVSRLSADCFGSDHDDVLGQPAPTHGAARLGHSERESRLKRQRTY